MKTEDIYNGIMSEKKNVEILCEALRALQLGEGLSMMVCNHTALQLCLREPAGVYVVAVHSLNVARAAVQGDCEHVEVLARYIAQALAYATERLDHHVFDRPSEYCLGVYPVNGSVFSVDVNLVTKNLMRALGVAFRGNQKAIWNEITGTEINRHERIGA